MKRGDQVIHSPGLAKDIEYGFITNISSYDSEKAFCRYWRKGEPGKLRTTSCSELTNISALSSCKSVKHSVIKELFIRIENGEDLDEEKSSKQKCLEMWEWFAENPGKNKTSYNYYLNTQDRGKEFSYCWACFDADEKCPLYNPCESCPIDWGENTVCCDGRTPYSDWVDSGHDDVKAAKEMVNLIKTTWEEEDDR